MIMSRALVAAAFVVAGAATALAAPFAQPMGMAPGGPIWHGGPIWRGGPIWHGGTIWHGGDHHGFHGGWAHRRGGLAIGAIAPAYNASGAGVEAPAPSIWIAPITLTLTTNAVASPTWSEGPKLIVIGRQVRPRHPLPLVIYGDPGA